MQFRDQYLYIDVYEINNKAPFFYATININKLPTKARKRIVIGSVFYISQRYKKLTIKVPPEVILTEEDIKANILRAKEIMEFFHLGDIKETKIYKKYFGNSTENNANIQNNL